MDFVVGIEILLSNNHSVRLQAGERTDDPTQQRKDGSPKANAVRPLIDICDELQGRYPKDFKFTGWHPHCRCRAISILKTEEEMARDTERILRGEEPLPFDKSANAVRSMPKGFNDWTEKNASRIEKAPKNGTLPYFLRDNPRWKEYGNKNNKNNKSPEENQRIEANRILSKKLKKDPDYKDVVFNPSNGGLKATHIKHEDHTNDIKQTFFEDKLTSTDLEKKCQEILYRNGYSCILESEYIINPKTGNQITSLDTTTNGERMDIRSVTKNGEKTISNIIKSKKKQLQKFNEVYGTSFDCLILYFYDPSFYNESKVSDALGQTIRRVLCVFKDGTIKMITKP